MIALSRATRQRWYLCSPRAWGSRFAKNASCVRNAQLNAVLLMMPLLKPSMMRGSYFPYNVIQREVRLVK